MKKWEKLADKKAVEKTMSSLKRNGINSFFVGSGSDAKKKVLEILPAGAEIMPMTSITLEKTGIDKEINESGKYSSIRKKLIFMDRKTQGREMQKLGAAPEWAIGSIHAVTEQGEVLIASQSGSQLPAYAYGADYVVWVAGTQKIVKNIDKGIERIYRYCLPLESERARKAYGVPGSAVNKLLKINNEIRKGRITLIFVNEQLGF